MCKDTALVVCTNMKMQMKATSLLVNCDTHSLLVCNFIVRLFLGIRKGANHPMLILHTGYRQVAINTNKHWNSSRPNGHEPSDNLFSCLNICRYSYEENKSQKLKILKSQSDGGFAHVPYYLVNNCVLIVPSWGRSTWCRLTWFPLLCCCYVIAAYLFTLNICFLFL